jgi:hypothetical protein
MKDFLKRIQDVVGGVGFLDEGADGGAGFPGDFFFAGEAAGGDDFDVWVHLGQGVDGGRAALDGHHHVQQHQGDFLLVLGVEGEGFLAVGGADDPVAEHLQGAGGDAADGILVIHHQDEFVVAGFGGGEGKVFAGCEMDFGLGGQIDLEAGTLSRLAIHVDEAGVAFNMPNAVERPRPVPLPISLVVKKGSKIRSRTSGIMPVPVSVMLNTTYGPGMAFSTVKSFCSSILAMVMLRLPPWGMASRALMPKFIRT